MKTLKLIFKLLPAFVLVFAFGVISLFIYNKLNPRDSATPPPVAGKDFVSEEVVALVNSKEKAQEVADSHGIKLKSYAYGVAVFTTSDPEKLVEFSKKTQKDGAPQLSLNWLYKTYQFDDVPKDDIHQANTPRLSNLKFKAQSQPESQSGLGWYHKEIYTEKAWEYTRGEGVTIAIIDTGIAINHPTFTGRISALSYNSHTDQVGVEYVADDFGHGTHVSGIAASASTDVDGVIVSGVAPSAEILMVKANIPEAPGFFEGSSIIRGINYAVEKGVDVINMSLGRVYFDGPDPLEQTAVANAVNAGVTIVAAVGNERLGHAGYPAAYEEVIAVSATSPGNQFDLGYSNYGPEIDVAAPGTNIYSASAIGTFLDNEFGDGKGYMTISGTSMASPNVAGVATLIKAQNPEYTPAQVRSALLESAQDAGDLGRDDYYGHGVVSAYASLLDRSELLDATYIL